MTIFFKKTFAKFLTFTALVSFSPSYVNAQSLSLPDSPATNFQSSTGLVGQLVSTILPIAIGIGGMLTVIFIIISGIQFITSGGDPKGASAAKDRLVYAIIGFIVLLLAYAALQIIDKIFLGTGVAG